MKRTVTSMLMVTLVIGMFGAVPASAQGDETAIKIGGWTGGLLGTYSAVVCSQKDKCSRGEAFATLGIYTGAGIGTALLIRRVGGSNPPQRTGPPGFEVVQTRVKTGDRISVTDTSGQVTEGIIESLSDRSLQLRNGNFHRDYLGSEIRYISQDRHTPDGRLMMVGATIGLAAGAIAFPNTTSPGFCTGKGAGLCVLGTAAVGGAVFAGLSAIPKRNETIFAQSTRIVGIDWQVAPVLSKDVRGAAVALSF
jgi:hypothetical protein